MFSSPTNFSCSNYLTTEDRREVKHFVSYNCRSCALQFTFREIEPNICHVSSGGGVH